VLIVALAAGCGGGHFITDSQRSPDPAPPDPNIQPIQPGQVITGTVTGTVSDTSGSGPVSGTVRISVFDDIAPPAWGGKVFRVVVEWDLTQPSGSSLAVQEFYYEQDAAGNIYSKGWSDSTTEARLTSASALPLAYPSPMAVGWSYAYTARFADGSRADVTENVLGLERVGSRTAYRVHVVTANTTTSSADIWFVPSLGYPVKWTQVVQQGTKRFALTVTTQ
jgi:hypothetical protein